MTGWLRDGYCRVTKEDLGNHSIAGEPHSRLILHMSDSSTAIMTDKFLDFSASRGNDLRAAGLKDGCRWCLCASRWKEALLAGKGVKDEIIPR
jgi:uncharacterized protein (DUF2237 family)